uniref:Uncharacterized protein n=1 Tax=Sphaerodactylus townsendi TaxID=933632 RepID=A0ACB8FES1_9SAUR
MTHERCRAKGRVAGACFQGHEEEQVSTSRGTGAPRASFPPRVWERLDSDQACRARAKPTNCSCRRPEESESNLARTGISDAPQNQVKSAPAPPDYARAESASKTAEGVAHFVSHNPPRTERARRRCFCNRDQDFVTGKHYEYDSGTTMSGQVPPRGPCPMPIPPVFSFGKPVLIRQSQLRTARSSVAGSLPAAEAWVVSLAKAGF